ncbi:hypothetical protein BKA66DRAFT_574514 [Pyrenochaeta sp. MPI-SDFR-AT-0127]|nr:hypothetical protein BKA66DRAFT_574514 [Pyrenochaeta sp. MPI-SDFR-AT-0127]
MHFLFPLLLLAVVRPAHCQSLEQICSQIKGIYDCKATLDIPSGFTPKNCKYRSFKPNSCKTKYKYKYPCPTWRQPGRRCDGWTCVPGTDETTIEVPCELEIKYQRIDICQAVRNGLGHLGSEVMTKTEAMCACGPEAIKLVSDGLFDAVNRGADISAGVLEFVGSLIKVQKCFIDRGFNVQETKEELRSTGALSKADGWIVFEAAEIDLSTYGELVAAVAPCIVGSCNPLSFFTNYLTRTQEVMGDQVEKILTNWSTIFSTILSSARGIEYAIKDLGQHLLGLPDKIEEIRQRVCDKDACLGPAIASFLQKISDAIATTKAVEEVEGAISDVTEDIPKMIESVNTVIEAAKITPDLEYLLQIARNFSQIEDILEAVQVAQKLPKLGEELQKDVSTIIEFVTTFGARANHTVTLFQDLLSSSWESVPLEFTTDSSGTVRAGMVEIQNLISEEINEPLQNVTNAFQTMENALSELPFRNGHFSSKAGVASYSRWNNFNLDMPCSTTGYQEFSFAGLQKKIPYPKFYACNYNGKITWPNHHIPYIKFRVA